jgi:multidrug resistance protein, MATE family
MTSGSTTLPVTRPTLTQLLALAVPVIISRSSQVVIGVTDAIMVGALGQSALAATTTGATNTYNLLILPMGVCFVVQSFASQLTGKGDAKGARRFAWYGLAIAAIAQLICLAALPVIPAAIASLPYASDVRNLMEQYLKIRLLSGGAAVGLEALGAYYGGIGNTRLPMVAQIIAMVLNVVLCWLLIAGHWGAPAMGVSGSAWAAALATTLAFGLLFVLFVAGVGCTAKSTTGFSTGEMRKVLRFGLPSGFNWFIEFAAFSLFINVVLPTLGTAAVAALMSVMQLNSVAFMPAFALSSAGSIFVGTAIGANARNDVSHTVWLTVKACCGWMGVVALVYLAFPRYFIGLFVDETVTTSSELTTLGVRMLMMSCAWQFFDAVSMAVSEALRAAGDTMFTFVARSLVAWCVFVPGVWLTVRTYHQGDVAAMMWLIVYLALLSLVLVVRFRGGQWRHIEMTEGISL